MPIVVGLIVAAALAGTVVYFPHPATGLTRRHRVFSFMRQHQGAFEKGLQGLQGADKIARAAAPRAKQAVDDASMPLREVLVR